MKKCFLVLFICITAGFSGSLFAQNRFWVAVGPSNWNNTANWSTTSGGAGGASVPGTGGSEVPVFNGNGLGNCNLDIAPIVPGITVNGYTGTIDLLGNNLTTTGANTFTSGTISNTGGAASVVLNTTGLTTFNGTTFTANITGSSGRLLFNGSTFNGTVAVTKTGNTNDDGTGNNTFGNSVTLQNSSANRLRMATTTRDIFNGTLNLTSNGTGALELAYSSAGNQLNNNVVVNYSTTGTISFGASTGTSTLAVGRTITIGTIGGSGSGNLTLARFTQSGATAQNIVLSGNNTSTITIGPSSSFGGSLTVNAPSIVLNSSSFQAFTLTKTGTQTDNLRGGNVFNGVLTVNNQGGDLYFGSNPADAGDSWLANATFNNTGGYRLRISEQTPGNVFSANATFNNTSVTDVQSRIQIGRLAGGITTFNGTTTFFNNGNASDIHISYDAGSSTTFNGPVIYTNSATTSAAENYIGVNGDVSFTSNLTITNNNADHIYFSQNNGTVSFGNGTLTVGAFAGGSLRFRNFTQTGSTALTAALTGTAALYFGPASTFNGNVNFTAPQLYLNGCTYAGSATLEKNGATDNASTGGNVFSGVTTITNSGSGFLLLGNNNADQFNGVTTFNNTGSYRIYFGHNHGGETTTFATDVILNTNKTGGADAWSYLINEGANTSVSFGGSLTINCAGSLQSNHRILQGAGTTATYAGPVTINLTNTNALTSIAMGVAGTSTYNQNITVSNSGGASGVYFNTGVSASSTLAATRTITIGGSGFSGGTLSLLRFTQLGATPQTLNTFSGTASLIVGPNSAFGGAVDFRAPQIYLNGCTYSGDASIEKTGATDNAGTGGNIFQGTTLIANSGSGYLLTANVNPDIFNNDLTVTNSGSDYIYLAHNVTGNEFNGNIILNNTGSALGIRFSNNAAGSSTFNAGATRTISIGGSGFTTGELGLRRFSEIGTAAQTLTTTGTASLVIGPNSQFDGNVNFSSPRLFLNGCTYGGTGTFEKTGDLDDAGTGGNIFTGVTTITNSGLRYLLLGNGTRDQFLSTTTFNNTGSFRIYFAHSHSGQTTEFASDLILNSNKTGGSDAMSYMIAEGANTGISVAGLLTINCAGAIQSTHNFLNGGGSSGTFGGLLINLTNSHPSTTILMGLNGTSTYSADISVSNSGGAAGITFNSGASASSELTGSIISGVFSSGSLNLYRFTQLGAFPQNITLTNAGTILRVGPSSRFDGDVNFVSPRLLLHGAIYNGTAYLEKNGASDDNSSGGNTFNGTSAIVNSGSGYILTANTAPDIFNNDVTITNSGSNYIYMAYNVPGNQFNGNITLNNTGSALGIRFSHSGTGSVTFNAGTDKTISVGGLGFSVGELGLRRFTQTGSSAQALTLTGSTTQMNLGPSSEFNGNVTFISPRVFLNGTRYNGTAYIEKTAANADDGIGGNTFNQTVTLVNSGSSYLLTGSTNPDIFNGTLILHNNSSSTIRLADNSAGNQFNENIELNSSSGGGIYFGNNVNATSTLAAGKTIAVGSSGFITGDVRLIRFTQVGPTPQTLNLGGIAILTLGPSSNFGGNIDFRAPQLYLNGTTFNGTSNLEKKGAGDNYSNGGNTFVGSSTITHSGSGYLAMALSSPDIFQSDLTATNTGANIIYLANNVTGNIFNGNITFNSTLGSGGIYIGNNATSDAQLGNGASLLTGGLGFSSGELRLKRLTQIGSSAQTLTLTGTALLRIGPATTFNGNINFRSPQIALDGAIYNGITYLEKTGAGNNDSAGGNSFLGSTTTIANSGTGWFRFALGALDTFGTGDLILTNTGTSTIRMADNTPGTAFNGNIFVNSTFGGGIYFSESGGGTATLAAGRTIAVGGTGFHTGELRIRRFTQADAATPQTLLLTGTAALVLGPTITFSGAADFRAPQVFMNGGTFNGTAFIEKTGATDNTGTGNMIFQSTTTLQLSGTGFFRTNGSNTFNGTTSIINSGSNYVLFELVTGSTYNGNLTLTNTGSSRIRTAYTGTTAYNGNIIANSTNGLGIYFVDNGTGSATLATGRTISVGGTGFTAGELSMPRFTQTGATAQNLVLTGTSTLRTGPATTWNGNFTSSSPLIFLDGTTFNGTTNSITKTGTTTDGSVGGNTFAAGSTTTLTNSGTGVFRLATTTADDFSGNVIFNQTSGVIQPAYNLASNFRGDVTVTSTTPIVFGANNGGAIFTGTTANQTVNKGGTASPIFRRLTMNKASGIVTLNTDASVSVTGTFTSGIIQATAVNYLNFENDATASGASNASFVDGPVRKTGNDAFTFPIGDGAFYRPAAISAPTAVAHYFIAQYINADHGLGSAGDPSFTSISKCEYWTIDRNPGVPPAASNVLVTLSWQEAACVPGYITQPSGLRVARWNGASWVNHGNGGTTGTATNGTIVTSGAVTSFSPFTLASAVLANPLPVELTSFTAIITKSGTGLLKWHTESELNNDRFEIERSENGIDFVNLGSVKGSGTTNRPNDYQFEDTAPVLSLVYYRLMQIDFDGESEYSSLVSLDFTSGESNSGRLVISPNPINSGSFASFRWGDRTIIQSVTVYNSVNQVVRQYSEVEGFSTEGLAPGIYIVKNKAGEIFRLVIK